MPSLDDHFSALTRIRPPDDWPDLDRDVARPRIHERPIRRRIGVAALALLLASAGSFLAVRAFDRSGPTTAPSPPTQVASQPPSNPPTPSPAPAPEHGVFGAMFDAIRDSSPPGWRFTLQSDRLDGDWRLDGNVDDGSGPGRLYVDVTVRPGMLEPHPCSDTEFRQAGRCVERPLPDGNLLVLRDVVVDRGGMKTIEAVLIHPDRSGVGAEAGNWTLAPLPHGPISQGMLSTPKVTRAEPLYTVEQLGRLVRAVDERTQRCIRTSCG